MSRVGARVMDYIDASLCADPYERAQTLYFNWLCVIVHADNYADKKWYILAKTLHDIEFYWTVPNDENRATDGIKMREVWLSTLKSEAEDLGVVVDLPLDALNGPCTMFEMMVGLSSRIESDIMQRDDAGNRTSMWFWFMFHNLVSWYRDDNQWWYRELHDDSITPYGRDVIKEMVRKCLDREYKPNGSDGCLFPVVTNAGDIVDRKDIELWYQAQDWVRENFSSELYD